MNGSEKQIKWAEDIKQKIVESFEGHWTSLYTDEDRSRAVNILNKIDNASFFIDARNFDTYVRQWVLFSGQDSEEEREDDCSDINPNFKNLLKKHNLPLRSEEILNGGKND
jgi:hypothetical protein